MNILAIDTTTPFFSIAYRTQGKEDYFFQDNVQWQHAEYLLDKINKAIENFSNLDYLVISRGPGGFTGLRIGLAVAKAFKIALPALNITTPTHFQLLAAQYFKKFPSHKEVTVVIDAKRRELVLQKIDFTLSPLGAMTNYPLEEVKFTQDEKVVVDSSGIHQLLPDSFLFDNCNAEHMLNSFEALLNRQEAENFEPIYFRPSDAKLPRSGN